MIYARDGEQPDAQRADLEGRARRLRARATRRSCTLARWACVIEEHYGCPMDMEWAKDGETGELFIVQARPETVQSRKAAGAYRVATRIKSQGQEARDRPRASAMRSWRAASACIESARDIDRFVDGADAGDAEHRSRLGADHEARRGDRHRSRRAHLARRHRQPRARPAGDRRHRQCDARPARRAGGDRVLRRGRRGLRLRGRRRLRGGDARPAATFRRRARRSCSTSPIRPRRSAGGGSPPTASGLRAWSSSSAITSRSIRWRWSTTTRLKDEEAKRQIAELTAAMPTRRNISSTGWRAGWRASRRRTIRSRSSSA